MQFVADLHIHTVASGHAYSTIDDIVKVAADKKLEVIAITDHGPGLAGGAHPYHFWNLRVLPREMNGVRVLRGAEANIMDMSGKLDLGDDILEELDIVFASLHPYIGYDGLSQRDYTDALLRVTDHPLVDIIAHPGNPNFPVDVAKLVRAAKKNGKILEINNSSFIKSSSRSGSHEYELEIAEAAFEHGLMITINSDAHIASAVGEVSHAVALAQEAGFDDGRVINTSIDNVRAAMRRSVL